MQSGTESAEAKLAIRDPYIFEFLGLKPKEVMSESSLYQLELPKKEEIQRFLEEKMREVSDGEEIR